MPARLTDAQVRNAREQALRATRRAERKLDTRIEVMERRLDRSIENKDRITVVVASSIIEDFRKVIDRIRELEARLTDMAIVFNSTAGTRIIP